MTALREKNDKIMKVFEAKTTEDIIAVSKAEDAEAERERILEKMTPACREKLGYFEKWLRDELHHTLRTRYELGLQVLELYEDERKNNGKVYGKNAIGRICKVLRWEDDVIRLALRFVRAYSKEDLERLCALILPNGQPLNWSHIRTLLTVDDKARRQELLERTAAEGWTSTELAERTKSLEDGRPDEQRGRPPRVPTGFDSAVSQQLQAAEQWQRRYTRVWAHPNHSLTEHAAKLRHEEITEERFKQAGRLALELRHVAGYAQKQAEDAEKVTRDFDRALHERQKAEKS